VVIVDKLRSTSKSDLNMKDISIRVINKRYRSGGLSGIIEIKLQEQNQNSDAATQDFETGIKKWSWFSSYGAIVE